MTTEATSWTPEQIRAVKRTLDAGVRYWDALRDLEHALGRDISSDEIELYLVGADRGQRATDEDARTFLED